MEVRILTRLIVMALLATALTAVAQPGQLSDESLVRALRAGGFTLYFRHAQTEWSQSDHVRAEGDWLSCDPARIRQLSASGRDTATAIGEAMRALNLPVGRVLASPYCRTVRTAELLGLGPVETSTDVMNLRVAEYFGGPGAIVATARAQLARTPAPGTNTVIVAHGNVAREATPVYPGEAEGVVFRPDGDGGFQVVAQITPAEWERLARVFAAR